MRELYQYPHLLSEREDQIHNNALDFEWIEREKAKALKHIERAIDEKTSRICPIHLRIQANTRTQKREGLTVRK